MSLLQCTILVHLTENIKFNILISMVGYIHVYVEQAIHYAVSRVWLAIHYTWYLSLQRFFFIFKYNSSINKDKWFPKAKFCSPISIVSMLRGYI